MTEHAGKISKETRGGMGRETQLEMLCIQETFFFYVHTQWSWTHVEKDKESCVLKRKVSFTKQN